MTHHTAGMRPRLSAQEAERRRRKAIELLDEGLSVGEVARRIGATTSSVYRWRRDVTESGPDALAARPAPGAPRKLDDEQREQLAEMLAEGPLEHGYDTQLWTCPRIADLIQREFGVSYHVDHIGRLLRTLGFSRQRPAVKAIERDEDAIDEWIAKDFERIKKK